MGLRSFLKSSSRLLRMSKKPDRSEFWQSIKITLLGTVVIGALGFIIKFISGVIQGITT